MFHLGHDMEETDREKADRIYEVCGAAANEAREWMDEMEAAYSRMRVTEVVIIYRARKIKPFAEDDPRCIYEFLKEDQAPG